MSLKSTFNLSNLTLLVALSLSAVAAYYSIIGLTAIFAGAVIPIIIMGSILEIGKITATVWLRKYWHKCGLVLKLYLVPAVILLALLTSMGIFGFLSKAHTEVGLVSGESQAKIAIIDEKIKTQRENIEVARKALQQLDAQVETRLARGSTEQGVERAVTIRRQQATERNKLQKEISDAQQIIAKLNEERAPVAAETRKIEAEVGPIKYIAALIYDENPNQNTLEKAVRWVIILLVIVFDPLAIALVLAANASREWDKQQESITAPTTEKPIEEVNEETIKDKPDSTEEVQTPEIEKHDDKTQDTDVTEKKVEIAKALNDPNNEVDKYAYLKKPFVHFQNLTPMVAVPETVKENKPEEPKPTIEAIEENVSSDNNTEKKDITNEIITRGVTKESPINDLKDGYVIYEGKHYSKQALKEMKPELFVIHPDDENKVNTNFGTKFPDVANKGDIFVRVDVLPNKVYKFSDKRWIEINKNNTNSYLYDQEYIKYLVNKISTGEYDLDLLTENERTQIEEYLNNQKT
jgi:hypothetical protein